MDNSLISRQAAIDAVNNAFDRETLLTGFVRSIAVRAIRDMPPAQPEPKEGHWKKDETDDCPPVFRQFKICSVCGAIETSETNYCPNCGAKMTNK